jgi:hypothetical protein
MGDTRNITGSMHESLRTIKTRDYVLSEDEMRDNGIRAIYNSTGRVEDMGPDYIRMFIFRMVRIGIGEVCLVESSLRTVDKSGNPLKVISLIVFHSEWAGNLYSLRNCVESRLALMN